MKERFVQCSIIIYMLIILLAKTQNRALQEIRALQRFTALCIPKTPFMRLVKDTSNKLCKLKDMEKIRWQSGVLSALQESAEWFLVSSFECMLFAS